MLQTFLLDRSRVVWLLIVGVFLFGGAAFNAIPRETTPTVEIPAASVSVIWPGASTGDTEQLVTNILEKKIDTLENLDGYTSISRSGLSLISVEFESGTIMSDNLIQLREKVDEAEQELPDSLPDSPRVSEVSISDIPILTLSISGDFSWSELKTFAEKIENEIEKESQVKSVNLAGAPTDAWHVYLDPDKLEAQNLSVSQVAAAIRNGSQEVPLGEVNVDGQVIISSLQAKLQNVGDFLNLPIISLDNGAVFLKDIGEIRKEFDAFSVETFFLTKDKAERAVSIDVVKSASKGNAITMTENILARLDALQDRGEVPETLKINTTYNRADEIRESLGTLTGSGSQTLVLIFLVMLLALGWRESVLASVSIPLALLVGIIGLNALGETFNGVSLFALVLAVGLLVDNAIIVVEGLHEGVKNGLSPRQSAIKTIQTFRAPILTGTLTTIFAFLPMMFFITGVSGDYIRIIPITIMLVLGAAFFVSLFLLPNLGVGFYSVFAVKEKTQKTRLDHVLGWYERSMKPILKSFWLNVLVIVGGVVAFGLSLSLVITQKVPVEVFPGSDFPYFVGEVTLSEGTELEETQKLIEPITKAVKPFMQNDLKGEVWVESVVFTAGRASGLVAEPGSVQTDESNTLGIAFNLPEKSQRTTKSYEIVPEVEAMIKKSLPEYATYRSIEQSAGPPSGSPIEFRISGDNIARLTGITQQIRDQLAPDKDLLNLRDSRTEQVTQINWEFDREKLSQFGLSPAQVSETLRAATGGITVLQITEGGEEIDLKLRLDWQGNRQWKAPKTLRVIKNIPLKTASGQIISFGQVATATPTSPPSEITHKDGKVVLYVRADLPKGMTASQKSPEIQKILNTLELLPNESVEIGGEAEEGNRLITEMSAAMGFAMLLILLVLVIQFNSFHQSIMVLVLIPLSLTGVFLGFWIIDMPISFPTMIGIVSLAGIIVNDAIVLIDQFNVKRKEEGISYSQALIEAGKSRFQPIFLTSVTTVFGMLPLSLSDEVWGGLGFAIIFGMLLSTVLCLLLLPSLLQFWHDLGNGRKNLVRKIRKRFGFGGI